MFDPRHAGDIASGRLCLGCGACAYICPTRNIRLVDFVSEGIRPVVNPVACGTCRECLDVCPAWENDHTAINQRAGIIAELAPVCGPVLDVWEGHATDAEIRFQGASGGIITALSLYALERESCEGVLHIGADPEDATRNKTALSRTRAELLSRTGSRYNPASACDRLDEIENASAPCLFVGQPSEVTALRKAQRLRPQLHRNVKLAISFFCAGTPSREGTEKLLESMHIKPSDVEDLRYRGLGWPGNFSVKLKQESPRRSLLTYAQSWGFVQEYRPFSTHLCPDGTGEDADISCGDPWYRTIGPDEPGSSLVLARTPAGRTFLQDAVRAGYVTLTRSSPDKLVASQKNLVAKRGAIGGRIAALKMLRLPAPRLGGFALFANWRALSMQAKLRSVLGTMRRSLTRGYHRPLKLRPAEPVASVVRQPTRAQT